MRVLLASLLLLIPLVRAQRCPHESVITPCTCDEHYAFGPEVTCKDFSNFDTLEKVFNHTYSFAMLNLQDCTIQYLKNTWFASKGVYKLQIRNVTAVDLFQNEGDTPAPSLQHMVFLKSKVLRRVRWQQFKPFTHLKTLSVRETEVKKLGKDFKEVSSRLESLSIDNSGLTGLEDGDFDGKTLLRSVSFTKNKIKVLKNSFFKELRAVLNYMDFSNNPIESIPTDFFEGMTALKYVYLRGAQIKTVSRISNFKGSLYLDENPLDCDCKMSWIINTKDFYIDGTCETPSFLKSKRLSNLNQQDFAACRNSLPFDH